ncbi:MAG: hypothetical protein WC393_01330 [Candidatus Nanoarchaeia archaeon]|jgi:hypothetical protein
MKILMATGKNGKLDDLGVNALEAYLLKEQRIKNNEEQGFNPFTPIYEADMKFEPIKIDAASNNYNSKVEEVYGSLIDSGKFVPGVYGDFFKFVETNEGLFLTELGNKSYNKPNEATDLGLTLLSKDNQVYSVFIKRKNEPGKGRAAFAGGFCDKKSGYVDSPLFTAIKEASEEFNFSCSDDIEKYRNDYNTKQIELNVLIGEKRFKGLLEYCGTFKTSNELMKNGGERISEKSAKVRVDKTHLYILTVKTDMSSKELEKALKSTYKAGDDAAKVIIENLTNYALSNDSKGLNDKLKCGILHHKDLVANLVSKASLLFFK